MSEPVTSAEADNDTVNSTLAARILGVSLATLYRWRHEGLHVADIGPYQFQPFGRYRYKRGELETFRDRKLSRDKPQ